MREASPGILTLSPGISGMVGLERIGEMRGGDHQVSAAAGLGHIVGADRRGARHRSDRPSDDKAEPLRLLGVDRVVNYRSEDLRKVLAEEYPRGPTSPTTSVGGEIFDAFPRQPSRDARAPDHQRHTSDSRQACRGTCAAAAIYRKLY